MSFETYTADTKKAMEEAIKNSPDGQVWFRKYNNILSIDVSKVSWDDSYRGVCVDMRSLGDNCFDYIVTVFSTKEEVLKEAIKTEKRFLKQHNNNLMYFEELLANG